MRFVLIGLFFVASVVSAGSITIDLGTGSRVVSTTAAQEAALQRLTDDENVQRAAQKPPLPAFTREEYLRAVMISAVQSYLQQARERDKTTACTTYASATATVRNQIDTALGGKSPCP